MSNNTHTWLEVFRKQYGTAVGQTRLLAAAEFNGDQYIGIGRPKVGGTTRVYRRNLQSGNKWQDCTPKWPTVGSHSNPGGDAMVLSVVNNTLFLGNDKGSVYFTVDGKSWDLAHDHGSAFQVQVDAIIEFDKNIYIAVSGDIVKGTIYPNGGINISSVVGKNTKYARSFGKHDLLTLAVLGKYLYAGVGKDNDSGIQIWRSSNGTLWELFRDVSHPPLVADIFPGHVHAMTVFKNHLYIGAYHGSCLYRTDGTKSPSATHWEVIEPAIQSSGDILRLEEYQGYLYMGLAFITHSPSQPECLMYVSSDGKAWNEVPGAPMYAARNTAVSLLKEMDGKLYVGDFGPAFSMPPAGDALRMWEMEGPFTAPVFFGQVPDLHEKNDTSKSATGISMDTKNKNLQTIKDFSLDIGDIDFLHIKFSTDQKGCHSGKKIIGFFGGLCTAEAGNSFLNLRIIQEQCIPIDLQIIYTDKSIYDNEKFLGGNDVYLECPYQVSSGDLLARISNVNGNPVIRYLVELELSEGFFLGKCGKPLYKFWEYQMPPWQEAFSPGQKFLYLDELIAAYGKKIEDYGRKLIRYEEGEVNHGLGRLAIEVDNHEIAEQRLRSSSQTYAELGLNGKRASVLRDLGRLHSQLGHTAEAEASFAEAMELHRSVGDSTGFALDELAVASHNLEVSPEKVLVLSSHAFSILKNQPVELEGRIKAMLLQSAAFIKLKKFDAAVAAILISEQLLVGEKESDYVYQVNKQILELTEIIGVWKYLNSRATIGENADILLESHIAKYAEKGV